MFAEPRRSREHSLLPSSFISLIDASSILRSLSSIDRILRSPMLRAISRNARRTCTEKVSLLARLAPFKLPSFEFLQLAAELSGKGKRNRSLWPLANFRVAIRLALARVVRSTHARSSFRDVTRSSGHRSRRKREAEVAASRRGEIFTPKRHCDRHSLIIVVAPISSLDYGRTICPRAVGTSTEKCLARERALSCEIHLDSRISFDSASRGIVPNELQSYGRSILSTQSARRR